LTMKPLTTDNRPPTARKRLGASIIFVNSNRQVLLFLRDSKPDIPYPDTWDVPGGHVEEGETPEECIVREMKEEMDLDLSDFRLFCAIEFDDRIEYTYWKKAELKVEEIRLTEGQCLRWFTEAEARATPLAYGFNEIVARFYEEGLGLGIP
jgi:8-oxo-dGTP diphosphatase